VTAQKQPVEESRFALVELKILRCVAVVFVHGRSSVPGRSGDVPGRKGQFTETVRTVKCLEAICLRRVP
jgi:hypothetical protein